MLILKVAERYEYLNKIGLFAIHLLTACGAPLTLLALLMGTRGDWKGLFALLGIALIIDGIDGPLARRFNLAAKLPRWSGASLDYAVDYASYVFVPAYVVAASGLLPTPWNWVCGLIIALSGVLYFADNGMKDPSGSFKGFPAVWNMVIFSLIVLSSSVWLTGLIIVLCSILTFTPIQFVHPVRVVRWRPLTLAVTFTWLLLAGFAIYNNLSLPQPAEWVFLLCCLYLMSVSALQQLLNRSSA